MVAVTRYCVGVPVISPLTEEYIRPAGNGGLILYVSRLYPPEAVTGVNAVTRSYCVNILSGMAFITSTGGDSTLNVNTLLVSCKA